MGYKHLKDSRRRRKEDMVWVMGDSCALCGYKRDLSALEFHHINPEEKEFHFNSAENRSWESVKEELKKCVLVCANCHREIHSGLVEVSLEFSYEEERAALVSSKIYDLKHSKQKYCKDCGVTISSDAERCTTCGAISKRVVERPGREELKQLIRVETFTSLSKKFKVSDNAIRKWCDKYNLPSKKKLINQFSDEEWSKI